MNAATIRQNAARTAWLVITGEVSGLCGALHIANFCATRKQAVSWCVANGYQVA